MKIKFIYFIFIILSNFLIGYVTLTMCKIFIRYETPFELFIKRIAHTKKFSDVKPSLISGAIDEYLFDFLSIHSALSALEKKIHSGEDIFSSLSLIKNQKDYYLEENTNFIFDIEKKLPKEHFIYKITLNDEETFKTGIIIVNKTGKILYPFFTTTTIWEF